jgi:peroxiredoxin
MLRIAACVALIVAIAGLAQAAEKAPAKAGVSVGDKAPAFAGLKGTDGKEYSLADLKGAKAVVVVFSCNTCPEIVKREDKFIAFAKQYADKGVKMIAINSNANAANTLDAMKERAEKKGFTFIYASDESQDAGRAFGATVTPHCFILDKDGVVQYTGAFDDGGSKNYVQDATDAILKGEKPATPVTKQFGCGIGIKKKA